MSFIRQVCYGALAGLAGSVVMHGFRFGWENVFSRDRRDTIFGFDREADVNAARLIYRSLSNERLATLPAARLGLAMHYAFGPLLGTVYAATGRANGVLFGILLWLSADEIPLSILRISNPCKKSATSHTGALAAHLLFGITVENTLRVLRSNPSPFRFQEEE